MKKLKFKIATPERVVYESEADSVSCPTELGEVTILPDHIPLVANLKPGEMRITTGTQTTTLAVLGGFLEVRPGSEVIVLADAAEAVEEIDVARAEEARERARKAMAEKTFGEEEFAATAAALERSLARLRVARKHRHKNVNPQI